MSVKASRFEYRIATPPRFLFYPFTCWETELHAYQCSVYCSWDQVSVRQTKSEERRRRITGCSLAYVKLRTLQVDINLTYNLFLLRKRWRLVCVDFSLSLVRYVLHGGLGECVWYV